MLERAVPRLVPVAPGMLEGQFPKKASTPRCLIMISTSVLETSRYPRSGRVLDTVCCGVVMTMGFYWHIHHMLHSCCLRVSDIHHWIVTHRHRVPLAEDAVVLFHRMVHRFVWRLVYHLVLLSGPTVGPVIPCGVTDM